MKASQQETLSIGQAAARLGVAAHVLRHWETVGLLAPARSRTGERRYSNDDLYKITLIVKAKEAGFSLDAIGEMFATRDPADREAMLQQQRADLQRRIAELQTRVELVETVLDCRHGDFARCPTFRAAMAEQTADAARSPAPAPGSTSPTVSPAARQAPGGGSDRNLRRSWQGERLLRLTDHTLGISSRYCD